MNQYEAMFLFDPALGSSLDKCEAEIRRLMDRAGAELVFCRKWDERRLAYKVKGRKRGVYVLTCFKAPPEKISGIERDAKISEDVLRILILRADGVTEEMLEAACTARGEERGGGAGDGESTDEETARRPARRRSADRDDQDGPGRGGYDDEEAVAASARGKETARVRAPKPEVSIDE